jgi:SAM-dependent methyltransferase
MAVRRFTGEEPLSIPYLLNDLAQMSLARNYLEWQYRLIEPYLGNRVLEVGCGTGNLTGLLLQRRAVIAVDRQAECVRRTRERYCHETQLRVEHCGPPDANFAELRHATPDSCVCLNVIEHIERDGEALAAMAAVLRPGGRVILLAPAFEALYGKIDYRLGHYRRYTKRDMERIASEASLEVAQLHYMNLPGFFGWWINARLFGRATQSPFQIRFFDRFIVPFAARIEALVPPLFGQSVLAVLRRPSSR